MPKRERKVGYIGLDIGGSNSRMVLLDNHFRLLASSRAKGAATSDPHENAPIQDLAHSLSLLIEPFGLDDIHLTVNLGGDNVRQIVSTIDRVLPYAHVQVFKESDGDVALFLGNLLGCQIVVLAGTGSIAVGEDSHGKRWVAGGLGPAFTDEGSAFWVGHQAIRHWLGVIDGRAEGPPMIDIPKELAIKLESSTLSIGRDLARCWAESLSRSDVARQTVSVGKWAGQGHAKAREILDHAGDHLATLGIAVANHLSLDEKVGVLFIGGMVDAWEFIGPAVLRKLQQTSRQKRVRFDVKRNSSWAVLATTAALMSAQVDRESDKQALGDSTVLGNSLLHLLSQSEMGEHGWTRTSMASSND